MKNNLKTRSKSNRAELQDQVIKKSKTIPVTGRGGL
jgi:hypothetical protein